MYCKYCGAQCDEGASYCSKCGRAVENVENKVNNVNANDVKTSDVWDIFMFLISLFL